MALSHEFTSHETVVVRTAKARDSPHTGTVPLLLPPPLNLAPFGTHSMIRSQKNLLICK